MDHTLLVVGASSEVGTICTKSICKNYKKIYLQFRTMNNKLAELISYLKSENIDVTALQADLSDDNDIDSFIKEISDTNVIPDSVLYLPSPKFSQVHFKKESIESFDEGYKIGVRAAVKILKAFIPSMSKNKFGRIVFLLSDVTVNKPPKFESAYVTSKYALLGLMKALSVEYIDKGITVNAISPDMMETKFLSQTPERIVEMNVESSPIKRNIKVSELIPSISMFLSEENEAITGQNLAITGGM